MNYRLQFIHCDKLFPTREEAIAYAKERRDNGDLSLFAEPMVLKYGETESDAHIILGIGAKTNETGHLEDNRVCFIDIDHTESEIEELRSEIEAAIEAVTVVVSNSATVAMHKEEAGGQATISADVKLADRKAFNDRLFPNIITSTEDGLFAYVNLEYDSVYNKFVFTVNGESKEIDVIQSPYVVGGYYDVTDESIHLTKNDGSEFSVSMKELIGEWTTEGEASMTPIVLKKDEIGYDDGIHTSQHQDVLKGDIRIADDMPNNILTKVQNGRALYVNGSASNIKIWQNGHEVSLQEAFESSSLCPVSSDHGNMIYRATDGIFADSNLEYNEHENKLVFSKTNGNGEVIRKEIDLVGVDLFKNIWYDASREVLVLQYTDNKGALQTVEISIAQLITEWDVRNGETNVTLEKTRNIAGQDILTANVNLATKTDFDDQILEERNHRLVVRGTAANIKYGSSSVKAALDELTSGLGGANSELASLEGKIGSGFTDSPRDNVTYRFEQLSQAVSEIDKWDVQPGEHLGAIILEKDHDDVDDIDILRAKVVVSSNPSNMLRNYDGSLFVDGSGIQGAVDGVSALTQQVASMQDEIDRIEAGAGLTPDGNYSPNTFTNYISGATSLADATEKLDAALKGVEDTIASGIGGTRVTAITSHDGSVVISSRTESDGAIAYDITSVGSAIDHIEYDSDSEKLIIYYKKSDGTMDSVDVNLDDLIEEYEFNSQEINTDNNVKFNVVRSVSGKTMVKADVDTFDCGEYEGVDRM